MTVLEGITLAIAAVGAVLGILNTWNQFDTRRVKIRVKPTQARAIGPLESEGINACIEVTNLSAFPVTIEEVGYLRRVSAGRSKFLQPMINGGRKFPIRLESRESVSAYIQMRADPSVKSAYAKTSCGVIATGKSPAFLAFASKRLPGEK